MLSRGRDSTWGDGSMGAKRHQISWAYIAPSTVGSLIMSGDFKYFLARQGIVAAMGRASVKPAAVELMQQLPDVLTL